MIEFKWGCLGPLWREPRLDRADRRRRRRTDFDHPNSLDFDLDSNYVVSFRQLGAVVKVNAQKRRHPMWQLGGARNRNSPFTR